MPVRVASAPPSIPPSAPLPPGPKLNLGCGPVQPVGWVNTDASNRAWFANRFWPLDWLLVKLHMLPPTELGPHVKIWNLLKPLPCPDNSVACIYAGEVWEHFEFPDAAKLTAECFRVLAPGGVLRVCVPDGVAFWRNYLALYEKELAKPPAERSPESLHKHVQMFFNDICTRRRFLRSMGMTHKWQYDDIQLIALFQTTGFVDVARMPYHKSRIPDIDQIERSDFLIVEGVKPS